MERQCPSCGSPITPGKGFCGDCGQNLTEPVTATHKELTFEEKLDKIQKYLPKDLTEKILSQRGKIEGERKQVTVMFCDLKGFTPMVEKIGADEAFAVMDQVYELLIHAVRDYEGTINEMKGDGIIALFGAPIALEDAPQRAIHSALSVHRQLSILNDKLRREKKEIPILRMRIGIHSGPVVVGTLGNDLRVEFKAVGDTVNLASRMEHLAEPGSTFITEDLFKLTEGLFRFEALGEKEIKGKEEPVNAYRVITTSSRRTRFDVNAETGLTPLVGRERELEILLDGFDTVKSGRGQAFSIVAEAGAGKSRLLYEFQKAVLNEEVNIREGKCLSYARNIAYHPIIDILKANFKIDDGDSEQNIKNSVTRGLNDIGIDPEQTLPYLLDLLSVKESGIDQLNISPELKKERVAESFQRIILKGSEQRPLIMIFEDLHWIDNTSQELLKGILDSIPGSRVLLLFSYRPEYVHTWGGKSFHNQLNLNRLSNRESLLMLHYLLGTQEIETDLEELVISKTEGIPFFVEEFTKSLKDLKLIERTGRCRLVRNIDDLVIPSSIQDVILARVDALPESSREVLQVGSVIAREFSHQLLKQVISWPDEELLASLSLLKDSELVYERGIFPETTYIFKHAFTQEAVYNGLLGARRKEIHNKIGLALESLYPDKIDEYCEMLAYHYSKAENPEKAWPYLKLSGEKASNRYAHLEAVDLFKQAVSALSKLPESDDFKRTKVDIFASMVNSYQSLGFPKDVEVPLKEGEKIAGELEDEEKRVFFISSWVTYQSYLPDQLLDKDKIEALFQDTLNTGKVNLIAQVAVSLTVIYDSLSEDRSKIELIPGVLELLEKNDSTTDNFGGFMSAYSGLCFHYLISLAKFGRFQKAEAAGRKALKESAKSDVDFIGSGFVEFSIGYISQSKGAGNSAKLHFQKCIQLWEEAKYVGMIGSARSYLGRSFYYLGDLKKALFHLEKGIEIQDGSSISATVAGHYGVASWAYLDQGFKDKALVCAEKELQIALQYSESHDQGKANANYGYILAKTKQTGGERAKQHILEGIEILEKQGFKPDAAIGYLRLAELCSDQKNATEMLQHLNKATSMFQEMEMNFWLGKSNELLAKHFHRKGEASKSLEHMNSAIQYMKVCEADGWVERYEKKLELLNE